MDGSQTLPATRLVSPTVFDYALVAHRMRQDEREQWSAMANRPYCPNLCAKDMCASGELSYALIDRAGSAICVAGFIPLRPGVYQVWGAFTEEAFPKHWRAITRETRRLMAGLMKQGAHRIEVCSLVTRTAALDWYHRGLGMRPDGVIRGYYSNGEGAVSYALVKEKQA